MTRIIELMIILIFIGIAAYAIYKIVEAISNPKPAPSKENTWINEGDLERQIEHLKQMIEKEELNSKAGIENAEAKLADYRERLKKAEEYKLKTKNL